MSAICPRFSQNAWRKDLCSNCFKSKEEHKAITPPLLSAPIPQPTSESLLKKTNPPKSIIKIVANKKKGTANKKAKVSFPKELSHVIGYGGEWADHDDGNESDPEDFLSSAPLTDDLSPADNDEDHELQRLTKTNTDFNTNNGNLLGDPEENIKKSFAALRLGTLQVDSDGKKQTLKINVTPFGTPSKMSSMKAKFELNKTNNKLQQPKVPPLVIAKKKDENSSVSLLSIKPNVKGNDDGQNSPPVERAMAVNKSLLDEISETLEKNSKKEVSAVKKIIESDKNGKIKFEINAAASGEEPTKMCISKATLETTNTSSKKLIARNMPISKDHVKPKISVFSKFSDSESNTSDNERDGMSAYYDVVETSTGSFENVPDGKDQVDESSAKLDNKQSKIESNNKSSYSNSQFISDMMLSAKTHSASYSLHEGTYMTSKITSDGLIVTKCNSDDALDSTGSSFDGSSDEETLYNMNRSESDSGIGISMSNDYQSGGSDKSVVANRDNKTNTSSNNSSDYEDIQVVEEKVDENNSNKIFTAEKSREMAGEPDGSADPDGNSEAPALPKSPPPVTADARMSFLHGLQKNIATKKPEVPAKPTVNVIKTFTKRQPTAVEQQVITQLQQVIKQPTPEMNNTPEKLTLTKKESFEYSKQLKKGRAPDPPPSPNQDDSKSNSSPVTPESDYLVVEKKTSPLYRSFAKDTKNLETPKRASSEKNIELKIAPTVINPVIKSSEDHHSNLYMRNPSVGAKSSSPVIREKDKRERATVNPKFRSLNTFASNRNKAQAASTVLLKPPSTPEPVSRKTMSMSEECLADDKKKKTKFSIKKFLRMGTSKTTDNLTKKDGIYSEVIAGDEPNSPSKPRLVIIHPIDINPTAVEVVKAETSVAANMAGEVTIVTGKPPAPPQRTGVDGHRLYEMNKPARPPPPKSAELRRKQKTALNIISGSSSMKSKADNVYANLGEIRSAIAPRKPERTASMREREAQLELAKKRQGNDFNADTASVCSSNGGSVSAESSNNTLNNKKNQENSNSSTKDENFSAAERRKKCEKDASALDNGKISSKLELFERNISENGSIKSKQSLNDGLKNSVQKINNTIDNYLKDKRDYESMYEAIKTPPAPPVRNSDSDVRRTYESLTLRQQMRSSLHDNASISGASCTRSEYGPARYGFNSLANIPRVISASYCGSEIGESDIYSPYSFYGSEAGGDVAGDIHDGVWGVSPSTKSRVKTTNRLRMRKGRSVVHKSIEDNYSAVVVANHEALAQVLEQLQQSPIIPVPLRPLANANLRFEDFTITEGAQGFVVGKRAFHAAIWASTPVTLALSADSNQISGVSGDLNQLSGGVSGALNPITEFCDLVPSYQVPLMPSTEVRMLQATISVLPRMQLDSLQSIGAILKSKSQILDKHVNNFRGSIPNLATQKEQISPRNGCSVQNLSTLSEENCDDKTEDVPAIPGMTAFDDVMCREVGFIMLQLVNGLKNLQSIAIEDMPLSLSNVVLSKEADNKDAQARLCVLQGVNYDEDEQMATLCKCAHVALTEFLPVTKLTEILSEILLQERSESLSKAKSVLEFVLWGPSDVVLSGSTKERESALQRWLDLERATVLHGLVRTRIELTVYDECHLMFLVRSNAKIMNEAAKIVSSFKKN